MGKSRQNSNTPNRLSVADRAELISKVGTREGEMVYQADINLTYTWKDSGVIDNGGTQIGTGAGWVHETTGAINVKWFGDILLEQTFKDASDVMTPCEVDKGSYTLDGNTIDFTGVRFFSIGIVSIITNTTLLIKDIEKDTAVLADDNTFSGSNTFSGGVKMALPIVDPNIVDQLWNNSGILTVSAG